jgi:hypothetical protein
MPGLVGQLDYSGSHVTFTASANDAVFGDGFESNPSVAAFAN